MPAYINTEASIHVKMETDPPLPQGTKGCEFYWQDWETCIAGFTVKVPELPEGTRVTGLRFTYVPKPSAAEVEKAQHRFDLPVGRPPSG